MTHSVVSEVNTSAGTDRAEAMSVTYSSTSVVETTIVAVASASVASLVTNLDGTALVQHTVAIAPHLDQFVGKETEDSELDASGARDAEAVEENPTGRQVGDTEDVVDEDVNYGEEAVETDEYGCTDADEDDELEECEEGDGDDLDVEEVLIEMGLESRAPPDRTTMVKRAKVPPRPTATGKRSSSDTNLKGSRPRKKAKKTNSAPPETTPAPEEEPAGEGEGEGATT
ncbi:hypothetical protein PsYK624_055480 [Phanerochaete sordida]|uniref:Uncharacterized protein n=1 Tax=Phanerochaete sordida TaxID=48140 RepID=A0A9P3G7E7_9APHY|nr:hypothetical protein PsYK624_055480 [Phanerochaete sordida]